MRWWVSVCVSTRERNQFPSVLLQPLGHLSALESTICERPAIRIAQNLPSRIFNLTSRVIPIAYRDAIPVVDTTNCEKAGRVHDRSAHARRYESASGGGARHVLVPCSGNRIRAAPRARGFRLKELGSYRGSRPRLSDFARGGCQSLELAQCAPLRAARWSLRRRSRRSDH